MADNKVPHNAFVVVGTGEGASFFRNTGNPDNISLEAEGELRPKNLADEGPSGKSPPDQSGKESMEATFSKQLANKLYQMAHAGKFDDLVIVMDPDSLGEIRPLLHQEVQDKLCFDLAKTLSNSTIEDIENALSAV